jgi:DNA-binding transcriptional ArsR family regulator
LTYQTEYIFENLKTASYPCKDCASSQECWNRIESDFQYAEGEETIVMPDKNAKDLKHKNRKGCKMMDGNELFIYNVLLNNKEKELNIDDITKLITYKGKSAMSENVLRETLTELEEDKYINKNIQDRKFYYRINPIRNDIDKEFTISYFCTLAVIWRIITPEELRLYTYIRFKHHTDKTTKGNVYKISQAELAKDLDLTQPRVSQMINSLIESKILDIWECKLSENGYYYYTYRLNK